MKAVTPFLAIALLLAGLAGNADAQRKARPGEAMKLGPPVKVGRADIGGVVSREKGPEAGVWVIAETADLPTQYAKVVVTDDKGRYMIPGLPKAKYSLWVRGYGLVDSAKVPATRGKIVYLTAVPAPSPKEAAQYYPALYWFSLLRVPEASEFPLGPVASQGQWLNSIKTGACQLTGAGLDAVEPLALARHRPERKLARLGHAQEREPVQRRVVLRRLLRRRRGHCGEIHDLAARGWNLRRVDQAVAAHPQAVLRLRQARNHVPAFVVGDDNLRVL